ncbi:MAG: hypothetical protein ABI352_01475 [Candidatus Dormibacter sp.]
MSPEAQLACIAGVLILAIAVSSKPTPSSRAAEPSWSSTENPG